MSKLYEVTFTLNVTEIVEADNEADAAQAFSELFSSPNDLVDCGTYKIQRVKE